MDAPEVSFFADYHLLPWLLPENSFEVVKRVLLKITSNKLNYDDYTVLHKPVIDLVIGKYHQRINEVHTIFKCIESWVEYVVDNTIDVNCFLVCVFTHIEKQLDEKQVPKKLNLDLVSHAVFQKKRNAPKEKCSDLDLDPSFQSDVDRVHQRIVKNTRELMDRKKIKMLSTMLDRLEYSSFGTLGYDPVEMRKQLGEYLVPTKYIIDIIGSLNLNHFNKSNRQL